MHGVGREALSLTAHCRRLREACFQVFIGRQGIPSHRGVLRGTTLGLSEILTKDFTLTPEVSSLDLFF